MEKILFLHQPKCGGTTIFSYLEQCYPSEKILFCYYNHFKPENQKVYKNFDNLFHSRYNDTNYHNNIDISKYDFICGHDISQLLLKWMRSSNQQRFFPRFLQLDSKISNTI